MSQNNAYLPESIVHVPANLGDSFQALVFVLVLS